MNGWLGTLALIGTPNDGGDVLRKPGRHYLEGDPPLPLMAGEPWFSGRCLAVGIVTAHAIVDNRLIVSGLIDLSQLGRIEPAMVKDLTSGRSVGLAPDLKYGENAGHADDKQWFHAGVDIVGEPTWPECRMALTSG